jgi:hypothetical protein
LKNALFTVFRKRNVERFLTESKNLNRRDFKLVGVNPCSGKSCNRGEIEKDGDIYISLPLPFDGGAQGKKKR